MVANPIKSTKTTMYLLDFPPTCTEPIVPSLAGIKSLRVDVHHSRQAAEIHLARDHGILKDMGITGDRRKLQHLAVENRDPH